jgi:hypothetical protein
VSGKFKPHYNELGVGRSATAWAGAGLFITDAENITIKNNSMINDNYYSQSTTIKIPVSFSS